MKPTLPSARSLALVQSLLFLSACFEQLPPPRTPEAQRIAVSSSPSAVFVPGMSPLAIEVIDGPAIVDRVVERTLLQPIRIVSPPTVLGLRSRNPRLQDRAGIVVEPVCRTPCYALLPPGAHELRISLTNQQEHEARFGPVQQGNFLDGSNLFRLANTIDVVVDEHPSNLRIALGRRRHPTGPQFAGGMSALLGAGFLLGTGFLLPFSVSGTNPELTAASIGMGASGVGLLSAGIITLLLSRSVLQPAAFRLWSSAAHTE